MKTTLELAQAFTTQWHAHSLLAEGEAQGRTAPRKERKRRGRKRASAAHSASTSDLNTAASAADIGAAYWAQHHCDALPLPLAVVFYDAAACLGCECAMALMQRVANIVGEAHLDVFTPAPTHGHYDAASRTLYTALQECNLDYYTARMVVRHRLAHHANVCTESVKPAQERERWKNRCQGLLEHLALLERGGI